jgi:hypothetical protein
MRLYKTETAVIAATEGTIGTTGSDRLTVTVGPAGTGRFTVTITDPQTNGVAFTGVNRITAIDSFGNTKTNFSAQSNNVTVTAPGLSGTLSGLGSSGNNVLNQSGDFSSGVADLTSKLRYLGAVGSSNFVATSANGKTGSTVSPVAITVGPAVRIKLEAIGSTSMIAGESRSLRVTLKDTSDNTVTTFNGDKSLYFNDVLGGIGSNVPYVLDKNGAQAAFGVATPLTFTAGVAEGTGTANGVLRLFKAGADTLTATDNVIWSSGTNRLAVTVTEDALAKFAFALAAAQTNGVAFTGTNTLTAQDQWGNPVRAFTASSDNVTISANNPLQGTITGLSGGNILSNAADFVNGVANLTGKLTYTGKDGTGTFSATSGTSKSGTSNSVTITAGGATRLVITGDTTQTAGGTNNLTISARDGSGNIDVNYKGFKTLVFSGADSSTNPATPPTVTNRSGTAIPFGAPTEIDFNNGVATVASGTRNGVMRLYRAQTAIVSVQESGGGIGSSGSDRLTVRVSEAPLAKFAWVLTTPQQNNVPFTGTNTLTAQDDWGNPIIAFNAATTNVTVSTTLGGSVLGLGSGANNILNQSTDFVSGVSNLTGKMRYSGSIGTGTFTASASGKQGTSGSVQITAGTATRLVITGATSQVAGTGQNLTITAKDSSGNTVTSYTGLKNLVFSGADSSLNPPTSPTVSNNNGQVVGFGTATPISFANGVASVSGSSNGVMRLWDAETDTIAVTDGTIGAAGADRLVVTVTAGALAKFSVKLATPQVNNVPFTGTNTVTAQDQWGNSITGFNAGTNPVTMTTSIPGGTIFGLGSGTNNILNRTSDFQSGVANLTTLGMRYFGSSGTAQFTATGAAVSGSSDSVAISPGAATKIVISGDATQVAGASNSLTLTARDTSNNIATGYTGNKSLVFSGAAASTNPVKQPTVTNASGTERNFGQSTTIAFVNGIAQVNGTSNGVMRLYKADSSLIAVTDGSIWAGGNNRLAVKVNAGPLGQFAFALTSPQKNSVPFTGTNTLSAQDDWGNVVSTFSASSNNVTITSNITGTVSGLGSLRNNVLNQSGDFVNGVANLTALGMTFTGVADTGSFVATSAVSAKSGRSATITIENPVPTFTTIAPTTASRSSAVPVTLTGTNFLQGVTVLDPGMDITVLPLTVESPTRATTTITVGKTAALGPRDVRVVNPTPGGGIATLTGGLTINNIPSIASIVPAAGVRGQTLNLLMTGKNFADGTSLVFLQGTDITVNAQTVTSDSTIQLNITIGLTAADGPRQFFVLNGGTYGGQSNLSSFSVGSNPAPQITSIVPDTAARQQTLEFRIRGSNFYGGLTRVDLGTGINVTSTVIDSTSSLRVTATVLDSAATGARTVYVINTPPGGGRDSILNGLTVRNPAPTLTGISAQNGTRLQTLNLTLTGTKFVQGVTTVQMGTGITIVSTQVDNPTQLRVAIRIDSSAALGPRDVVVQNPAPGGGEATLASAFTVNNPAPTIVSVAPDSVAVGNPTLTLSVNGTGFVVGSVIRLGTAAYPTTLVHQALVTAEIPAADLDTARSYSVTVFNQIPGGGTSNAVSFTVVNPKPTLASITPNSGSRLQTMDIVFRGTNFRTGVTQPSFGGSDIAATWRVDSASQLTASITISGSATLGPRDVYVFNPSPGGGESERRTFTIANNPVPTITSVSPTLGTRLSTMDVVIQGTNFISGVTSVSFGAGVTVGTPVITASNQLTVSITIAAGAATGARSVSVTNAAPGGGTASLPNAFTILNPEPTLTSVVPQNAQQLQTLNVVFHGGGFIDGVSVVNMGDGITINSRSVLSDSQITASVTVTASAVPGPRDIFITNLAPGGGTATLINGFVVGNNPTPTLSSITPGTGTRLQTLDVVFRGTNFLGGGVTSVDFGQDVIVNSTVVDSAVKLTASITILGRAATGERTVYLTNAEPGGGRDSLVNAFTVTNPAPTLTSLSPRAGNQATTINVVLRGSNFIAQTTTADFGPLITTNSLTVDSASRMTANITIDPGASPGDRNVVVRNPQPGGGVSAVQVFTVNLETPGIPVLLSPANGSPNLPTSLTLRWDPALRAASYHLQVSTSPLFTLLVVDDSLVTTTSRRIGPLNNNVTYYWRVRARNAGGMSSFSTVWNFTPAYPATIILSVDQPFPLYEAPGQYAGTDYRLVGLPGAGTSPVTVFLPGAAGSEWQMYWDNGAPSNYLLEFNGSSTFTFSVGRGFWLVKRGNWQVNASVDAAPLDTGGAVTIPLHAGWNIVTNPFASAVPWIAVNSVNGNGLEPIWRYAGSWSASADMATYEGYYFLNDDSLTSLRIPYAGTSGVLKAVPETADEEAWRLQVELYGDSLLDGSVTFGVASDAAEGLDRHDHHKPRALLAQPEVTVRRAEMDPLYPFFASDIRPPVKEVGKWQFEVQTSSREPVTLVLDPVEVPSNLEVFLVDVARAKSIDVRKTPEYRFTPVAGTPVFTVLVGTADAVQRELQDVLPREFSLGQNFPNPFNPSTTIPVAVPYTTDLSLKVYNILGEEVRTLLAGTIEAGRHWIVWDGKNNNGTPVATGVYISRLTSSTGAAFVGKMVLMK